MEFVNVGQSQASVVFSPSPWLVRWTDPFVVQADAQPNRNLIGVLISRRHYKISDLFFCPFPWAWISHQLSDICSHLNTKTESGLVSDYGHSCGWTDKLMLSWVKVDECCRWRGIDKSQQDTWLHVYILQCCLCSQKLMLRRLLLIWVLWFLVDAMI